MKYRYQKPNPSIAAYVRTALIMETVSDTPVSGFNGETDLPLFTKGMPALFCRIEKNIPVQLTLYGQSVPDENWTIKENTLLHVYFFKPFCLASIFKIQATELNENPVELNNWNPQKAIALNVQLHNSPTIDRKTEILDHFILSQIQNNLKECEIIQYATDKIMYDPATDILTRIMNELNLTERTFQRTFKKYVGVTPNQYRRVCQFHFAFEQLRSKKFENLTDLAYTNGYTDQSHYIRSFREFTHTTPGNYLRFGLFTKKD